MTQATERPPYKNPPIEEALVEFHFAQEQAQEWDLTIPGKLHQHPSIKNQYPGKPRQQKITQATLQPGQLVTVHEGLARVQLVDQEAKRLISLGPGILSINTLRPYEGWEKLRPRIEGALKTYSEVAEANAVVRIGIRYINNIVIPSKTKVMDIGTYFNLKPPNLPTLPQTIKTFKTQIQYAIDEGRTLLVTHAALDSPEDAYAFLLDIDLVWEGTAIPIKNAMGIVDELHEREGKVFEMFITDETRRVFNAN